MYPVTIFTILYNIVQYCYNIVAYVLPWASKAGDGENASPEVKKKIGGDVPSRFENQMAQIRCLFWFIGYFQQLVTYIVPRKVR